MIIESSFVPFPSEIVVPPAARKAAQGLLNPWWVMTSSTLWALIWALVNYYLSLWLWRKIIYKLANTKLAHMLLITKESIVKAEDYFRKYGKTSTFVGRLIPAIRQLISIPAWLAKMDMKHFIVYTLVGAWLWNGILFVAWYLLGQHWDKVKEYNHIYTNIIYAIIIIAVVYIAVKFLLKKYKKSQPI